MAHFKKAAVPIGTILKALEPVAQLQARQPPQLRRLPELLRPLVAKLRRMWDGGLSALASLQPDIDTSLPAFDVEEFDTLVADLDERIRGEEVALAAATVEALTTVSTQLNTSSEQKRQRNAELAFLQEGKSSAHPTCTSPRHCCSRKLQRRSPKSSPAWSSR